MVHFQRTLVSLTLAVAWIAPVFAQSSSPHPYPPPVIVAPLIRRPVQQASHDRIDELRESALPIEDYFDESFPVWGPPPHRIIQPPQPITPSHPRARPTQRWDGPSTSAHVNNGRMDPQHHVPILPEFPGVENDPKSAGPGRVGLGTHWIQPQPDYHPPIPGATVEPRWKTPYSYGYFGAEGKRQWTRQHGYRDRYLQWSLR